MAKPKLLLIPSAQGSKFYSVLPSSGVGDFDFTRSGGATRINSQGLIETVADGVSRLNYPLIDGKVVGCPSHLLEPQRTNSIQYSEDFTQWNANGSSIISNSAISPDGTLNADKITATNTDPAPYIYANVTATEHTFSFYYKGEANSIGKQARVLFWFVGTATGTTTSVNFTLTGDWQRFESQITPTGAGTLAFRIDFPSDVAVVGDYGYLWGAQLEQGSYPTSYIPNYGTSAGITRSAETANGAGDASTFNDSEGVLMVEASALANDVSYRFISISDGNSNNKISLYYGDASNRVTYEFKSGGVASYLFSNTAAITNFNKILVKYKLNDFQLWINGFKILISTSGATPVGLSSLNFDSGIGADNFYGNTKQIQYFDSALNDSDLETLTSWVSFTDMANGQLYSVE